MFTREPRNETTEARLAAPPRPDQRLQSPRPPKRRPRARLAHRPGSAGVNAYSISERVLLGVIFVLLGVMAIGLTCGFAEMARGVS